MFTDLLFIKPKVFRRTKRHEDLNTALTRQCGDLKTYILYLEYFLIGHAAEEE